MAAVASVGDMDELDYGTEDMSGPFETDAMYDDSREPELVGLGSPNPKLRSTITGGCARKTRGRGFRKADEEEHLRPCLASGRFDSLSSHGGPGPQRSIEGWIVLVTGVHEEAREDDLHNVFREYGQIKNLHLNLDRRTGFVKGYAMIEYEIFDEALAAIIALDGAELLTQTINVDWAFSNGPLKLRNLRRSPRAHRSRSPLRRRY